MEFGNTGVEPCPPGSPRRVFRAQVGVGFYAFWVVAARLLMSLSGVSSIAAGWSFEVRRRGIGFRTAAHFQPDAFPRSRPARSVREMTGSNPFLSARLPY
jgi:hypothetical protein